MTSLLEPTAMISDPAGLKRIAELAKVESLMSLMKPSYLQDDSHESETMRRVLFAGAIAVADAVGGISAEEIKAIESFFGLEAVNSSGVSISNDSIDGVDQRVELFFDRMQRFFGDPMLFGGQTKGFMHCRYFFNELTMTCLLRFP
jgi:hypothetical protein